MKVLVEYAKSFIGTAYIYGGSSPIIGWDCSEFAREILRSVGMGPKADSNAKMLYAYMVIMGAPSQKKAGAFVFYGKNLDEISHIAFMINDNQVIEMGGGDSTTTNIERAHQARAYCRIRPITHRTDIVAVMMPNYPAWVIE